MGAQRETVEYNGDKYHRYPESDHHHLRDYFWRHTQNNESPVALHRQKWMDEHGEIPEGHIIHHADGDPLNNDINNLEAISREEHAKRHPDMGGTASDEHLEKMLSAAAEWHQSDEGQEWHKQHYENVKEELHKERYTHECDFCGEEYTTNRKEETRFCSDSCRQKHYYRANQELRTCPACGDGFETYKYSDTTYCSISCSNSDR
jgi:endogenous inhibitor of DNA gyrase (YacG/DUF329 family)